MRRDGERWDTPRALSPRVSSPGARQHVHMHVHMHVHVRVRVHVHVHVQHVHVHVHVHVRVRVLCGPLSPGPAGAFALPFYGRAPVDVDGVRLRRLQRGEGV